MLFVILCSCILEHYGEFERLMNYAGLTDVYAEDRFKFYVHFYDVGQGDCSIISYDKHCVVIDGGEKINGKELYRYIRKLGYKKVDCIIATHPHSDHIGGLIYLVNHIEADFIVIPVIPDSLMSDADYYDEFTIAVQNSSAQVIYISEVQDLQYGGINLTLIPGILTDNMNNCSLVTKLNFQNISVLFCADIETECENYLIQSGIDLSADVIKVPHHGSDSSSSDAFINTVKPKYAIISDLLNNSYGHPDKAVMKRYKDIGAEIYRTDIYGNVILESDGDEINMIVERNFHEQ